MARGQTADTFWRNSFACGDLSLLPLPTVQVTSERPWTAARVARPLHQASADEHVLVRRAVDRVAVHYRDVPGCVYSDGPHSCQKSTHKHRNGLTYMATSTV